MVIDNVCDVQEDDGSFDPETGVRHDAEVVGRICLAGCEAIRILNIDVG